MGEKIVFWLPFGENGEPLLDQIRKGDFEFTDTYDYGRRDIEVENWKIIRDVNNLTVIKFENDPYCYLVCSLAG